MPGRDGHGPASPLSHAAVGLVQGLVDVHKRVDDHIPVRGVVRHVVMSHVQVVRGKILVVRTQSTVMSKTRVLVRNVNIQYFALLQLKEHQICFSTRFDFFFN